MRRSVAQKMGIREGMRAHFAHAPDAALRLMDLPSLNVSRTLRGDFDYLHLFVLTQAEMIDAFPQLKAHLGAGGMLWVSWPKGHRLGTDLTLAHVIRIGYDHGLVESTTLSVDSTWSAIKFTYPKPGKVYQNSYGTLPSG
jgi:hypothetical protein